MFKMIRVSYKASCYCLWLFACVVGTVLGLILFAVIFSICSAVASAQTVVIVEDADATGGTLGTVPGWRNNDSREGADTLLYATTLSDGVWSVHARVYLWYQAEDEEWYVEVDGEQVATGQIPSNNNPQGWDFEGLSFYTLLEGMEIVVDGDSEVRFVVPNGYVAMDSVAFERTGDHPDRHPTTGVFGPHVSGHIGNDPVWRYGSPDTGNRHSTTVRQFSPIQWSNAGVGGDGFRAHGLDESPCGAWEWEVDMERKYWWLGDPETEETTVLDWTTFNFIIGRNGGIQVKPHTTENLPWTADDTQAVRDVLASMGNDPTGGGADYEWQTSSGQQQFTVDEVKWLRKVITMTLDSMEENDVDWASQIPRCPGTQLDGMEGLSSVLTGSGGSPTAEHEAEDVEDDVSEKFDWGLGLTGLSDGQQVLDFPFDIPGVSPGESIFSVWAVPEIGGGFGPANALASLRVIIRAVLVVLVAFYFMRRSHAVIMQAE